MIIYLTLPAVKIYRLPVDLGDPGQRDTAALMLTRALVC